MGISTAKIVLITSGQPALNPRLVKEADLLADKGYEVTVLYQYWTDWATEVEKTLLPQKKWTAIQVGGSPDNQAILYWYTRIRFKLNRILYKYLKLSPDAAIARCTSMLVRKAKQQPADLYIAHNLGALPAAFKAAKLNKAKYGFDAEDFHRNENTDDETDISYQLNKKIEDKYIPQTSYLTASSPLTAVAYEKLYNKSCQVLLNVLPKTFHTHAPSTNSVLQILWFSQTVGNNRGIETIVEALNYSKNKFEFHLLGRIDESYRFFLISQLKDSYSEIFFHKPLAPDNIPAFGEKFDIGIASEPGFSKNNNFALSNKIFMYIQLGMVTIASNTPAQTNLLTKYKGIGFLYDNGNAQQLADALDKYHNDRALLLKQKTAAFKLGQSELNWETESNKLIAVIQNLLGN